jgi:hypothetical protein
MTTAVALVNLILGTAYCGYGVMTAVEMKRDWRSFGFSHFGMAWILMAFTCGPHHLFHGVHLALEGRAGGAADLVAVLVGLPVGVTWLALRVEAFFAGRGDRFVVGTPGWLRLVPLAAAAYTAWLVWTIAGIGRGHGFSFAGSFPNLVLVPIYVAIGWFIVRTQFANRPAMGGWSVSGLCLSVIFPTCAAMHAVFAAYATSGLYHHDVHGGTIDWLSIPAGLYFLAVVRGLYRDSLRDWNRGPAEVVARPAVHTGLHA